MSFTNEEIQNIILELTKAKYLVWKASQGKFFCEFGDATLSLELMHELGHRTAIGGSIRVIKDGFAIATYPITITEIFKEIPEQAKPAVDQFHAQVAIEYLQYKSAEELKGKVDGSPKYD